MTDPTPAPAKPRRWLMPLLIASLAANLMVAGIVAGSWLSPDGPRKRDEGQRAIRGVLGEPFFRALPEDQRREMAREVMGDRDRFREGREALRARFENFLAALRAETFDRAELERLLADQRQAAVRRQDFGESLLLDRLEAMTQAERAAYADALEDRLKGFRRR